jgi:hypothetical protein
MIFFEFVLKIYILTIFSKTEPEPWEHGRKGLENITIKVVFDSQ